MKNMRKNVLKELKNEKKFLYESGNLSKKEVDALAEKFYDVIYNDDLGNFWKLQNLLDAVAFAIHKYTDEDEKIRR